VIASKLRGARTASATHKSEYQCSERERGCDQRGSKTTMPALAFASVVDDTALNRRVGLMLWRRFGDDHRYVLL
jgi:hypothetical protein